MDAMKANNHGSWPLARALAWVVFALMLASAVYTGWIALANFDRIRV